MNKKLLSPFQNFVKIESLSGIILSITTVIAIIWANSNASDIYKDIWQYELGIITDNFIFSKPIILWINDGLMAIFFFLIGLEIKREILIGKLNSTKKIAFPLFGAVGGMIIPIVFFLLLNQNPVTKPAWGIPMATDIAFSLAILNALGNKIHINLKIFLTAFAIVDDIGAVIIIAIFYTDGLNLTLLIIAFSLLSLLYFLVHKGFYSKYILVIIGISIWVLFLRAGLHPTIAGILLAFSVPVRQNINTYTFLKNIKKTFKRLKKEKVLEKPVLSDQQITHVNKFDAIISQYKSPLQSMENGLHGWVAYFIIPLFALANAGIELKGLESIDNTLVINIAISMVLGKSIGVSGFVLLAKRLNWVVLPAGLNNLNIIGVSFLAGIGFTMAIFIGNLAFVEPEYLNSVKIGILIGSGIAALIGYFLLRYSHTKLS